MRGLGFGFGFYKSRRYFQRVLFSIMIAMALVLTGLSAVNSYVLERSVRSVQEDSNLKVLTQIQYNLSYMNEIIVRLSTFAYGDNFLIPLMYSEPLPQMDYIRGYNEMEKLMESSSFLHSMAVYNAGSGELYGSSSEFLVDGGETKRKMLDWLLRSPLPLPTSRLIPVSLGREGGDIDAFAFIVTDALRAYEGKESALILYIKPDWVFDSLRRMNGAGSGQGAIFIRTPDGNLLSDGQSSGVYAPKPEAVTALVAGTDPDRDASSGFVVGNAGDGKSIVTFMRGIGDWTILYIQPYAPLMKEVRESREKALLVTGAFLLIAAAVSFWLSFKLYGPIDAMLRRIRPHVKDGATGGGSNELDLMGDNVLRLSERLREISAEQIVEKHYLRTFLSDGGSIPEADMAQLIERHGLQLASDGPYCVCVFRIDRHADYERATTSSARRLHAFAILNIAQEQLSGDYRCETVDMHDGHSVLILSGPGVGAGMEAARPIVWDIQDTIERYYGLSLTCGIGDPVSRLSQLSAAYRQSCQLCLYMFAKGYKSIVLPEDVRANLSGGRRTLPPDIERRLTEALKKGQLTNAGGELEKAFALLTDFQYDDMLRAVSDLAWAVKNTAAEMINNRLVSISIDPEQIPRIMEGDRSLEDIYMSFLSACAQICETQRAPGAERYEWIVGTIKTLIEQKFQDPNLSQQSIASTVKLTSAYVGKLFKDQCGTTVTEYMNEVRLAHARRLLLQTDDTIADIMDQCGYSNQSYFFRLFKGKFGSTPKEYRIKRSLSS
ncbi:helix-turn-helix domain-containing protein [Cohnella hashimotonis]|uniref:Helix-turn-helix domain-containing protein n=1 Tax=Cohnella hashimotonis TaxID=2826895 RepID=A0ABT6TE40_9BACL|nr:helix-turn-helix domain-containing protein [Cohnella hashimotonis]MDI4645093.1 helix-turn-helix domain-containing protein [Cohnella hashimotonis]